MVQACQTEPPLLCRMRRAPYVCVAHSAAASRSTQAYGTIAVAWFESLLSVPLPSTAVTT